MKYKYNFKQRHFPLFSHILTAALWQGLLPVAALLTFFDSGMFYDSPAKVQSERLLFCMLGLEVESYASLSFTPDWCSFTVVCCHCVVSSVEMWYVLIDPVITQGQIFITGQSYWAALFLKILCLCLQFVHASIMPLPIIAHCLQSFVRCSRLSISESSTAAATSSGWIPWTSCSWWLGQMPLHSAKEFC